MLNYSDILTAVSDTDRNSIIVQDETGNIVYSKLKLDVFKDLVLEGFTGEKELEGRIYLFHNSNFNKEKNKFSLSVIKDITEEKREIKELEKFSLYDNLTEIFNRNGIAKHGAKLVKNAIENKGELVVVLCDLDHFKDVNDTYGHLAGDYVLRKSAKLIEDNIPKENILARFGGEEFFFYFENKSTEQSKKVLSELKDKFECKTFSFEGNDIKITSTFGVYFFKPTGSNDFAKMLDNADKTLYFGKNNGRNQINYYDEVKSKIPVNYETTNFNLNQQ